MAIDERENENLNVDSVGGRSVNAIRSFPGRGTLVWGARTMAGNDPEWRYVNVRRYFAFVEESIDEAMQLVTFEPNEPATWAAVRAGIEDFLHGQWKTGALQGRRPQDGFFVAVGLGQTMTQSDIDEGRLIVEIGLAPVRPAEFVVLRITHAMGTV